MSVEVTVYIIARERSSPAPLARAGVRTKQSPGYFEIASSGNPPSSQ